MMRISHACHDVLTESKLYQNLKSSAQVIEHKWPECRNHR